MAEYLVTKEAEVDGKRTLTVEGTYEDVGKKRQVLKEIGTGDYTILAVREKVEVALTEPRVVVRETKVNTRTSAAGKGKGKGAPAAAK